MPTRPWGAASDSACGEEDKLRQSKDATRILKCSGQPYSRRLGIPAFCLPQVKLRAARRPCWRKRVKAYMRPAPRDLSDAQWTILDPLIPEPERRKDGRGRPWKPRRSVLNGILWVLRTGAPWSDLPERYPSYQTCHRRFQQWVRSGIMRGVVAALAEDLRMRGRLDVREAFIDGSFAPAKKGDLRSARQNVAREQRSWQWQSDMVFPWLFPSRVLRFTK